MASTERQLPDTLVESIAGLSAGLASTLVAHPLDLIKTRLQVDRTYSSQIGGSIRIIQDIARNEGIHGVYRGVGVNALGNSVSWALYFAFYSQLKAVIEGYRGSLAYPDFFIASGGAGALTALCTNPIWVIKTRMLSTSSRHPGAYTSMADGARQIFRSEGMLGFYRGLVPSLVGVSHGALQFMAYEQLKIYRLRGIPEDRKELSAFDFLLLSGVAKVFAGSLTYPYQVVRTRLQMYDAGRTYKGTSDAVAQVWRKEGFAGFYKGLGPNLLRVLPSTWVTFLVYEKTKMYVPHLVERVVKR